MPYIYTTHEFIENFGCYIFMYIRVENYEADMKLNVFSYFNRLRHCITIFITKKTLVSIAIVYFLLRDAMHTVRPSVRHVRVFCRGHLYV